MYNPLKIRIVAFSLRSCLQAGNHRVCTVAQEGRSKRWFLDVHIVCVGHRSSFPTRFSNGRRFIPTHPTHWPFKSRFDLDSLSYPKKNWIPILYMNYGSKVDNVFWKNLVSDLWCSPFCYFSQDFRFTKNFGGEEIVRRPPKRQRRPLHAEARHFRRGLPIQSRLPQKPRPAVKLSLWKAGLAERERGRLAAVSGGSAATRRTRLASRHLYALGRKVRDAALRDAPEHPGLAGLDQTAVPWSAVDAARIVWSNRSIGNRPSHVTKPNN